MNALIIDEPFRRDLLPSPVERNKAYGMTLMGAWERKNASCPVNEGTKTAKRRLQP